MKVVFLRRLLMASYAYICISCRRAACSLLILLSFTEGRRFQCAGRGATLAGRTSRVTWGRPHSARRPSTGKVKRGGGGGGRLGHGMFGVSSPPVTQKRNKKEQGVLNP